MHPQILGKAEVVSAQRVFRVLPYTSQPPSQSGWSLSGTMACPVHRYDVCFQLFQQFRASCATSFLLPTQHAGDHMPQLVMTEDTGKLPDPFRCDMKKTHLY